jgi:hypothetical protein
VAHTLSLPTDLTLPQLAALPAAVDLPREGVPGLLGGWVGGGGCGLGGLWVGAVTLMVTSASDDFGQ